MTGKRLQRLLFWLWQVLPLPLWVQWAVMWTTNTKFLVGVVAVTFDAEGRVLVARHTYRNSYPWALPGGWVKGNEVLASGLARELAEETGLDIAVGEVFFVDSGFRRPQLDVFYLCSYRGGVFVPNPEIAEVRFCTLEELPGPLQPGHRAIIERAMRIGSHRQ